MKKTFRSLMLSFALATGIIPAIAIAQDTPAEAETSQLTANTETEYREFGQMTINQAEARLNEENGNRVAQAVIQSQFRENIYVCLNPMGPLMIDFAQGINTSVRDLNFGKKFYAMTLVAQEIAPEDIDNTVTMCAKTDDRDDISRVMTIADNYNNNLFTQVRFYEEFAEKMLVGHSLRLELPAINPQPDESAAETTPPFNPNASITTQLRM